MTTKDTTSDGASPVTGSPSLPLASQRPRRAAAGSAWAVLRRPVIGASIAYLVIVIVAGTLAPWIAPQDPNAQDVINALQGPSVDHLLGTDTLGRDVLSRMLYAILPTLGGAVQAVAFFIVLGVPLGVIAGYVGGRTDLAISRTAELFLSIPPIIIVLVVLVVFSGSTTAAMVTLGLLGAPGLVRVVRASALAVREELFVTAAQVSGIGPGRIMATHVLRRVRGPILVQVSLFSGIALVFQAALSFLGLTSGGGRPTWGGMLGEASAVVVQQSWLLVPPGVAITLTVLAFGYLGDAARDLSADERPVGQPASRPTDQVRHDTTDALDPAPLNPGGAPAMLQVRNLTVHTAAGVPLVTGVSFDVGAGETVGLVGESGCGKSLTALSVLGLLPKGLEQSGSVTYDAVDLTAGGKDAYARARGRGIAYVSQDPMSALDPAYTVARLLDEVIALHDSGDKSVRRARAEQLLADVQIHDIDRVMGSYPHQISGGMAQRVSIALALAGRPKLIVADEPTTALDVTVQAEVLEVLRRLQERHGLAVLLITHDWGVVADLCDRAVVMYAGQVVEEATVADVFHRPRHPYSAALLASDVSKAPEGRRLPALSGRVPAPGTWPTGCRFADRCPLVVDECRVAPVAIRDTDAGRSRCLRTEEFRNQEVMA